MPNHWEIKCVTCGHRKGSHRMIRNTNCIINGVAAIGQCGEHHTEILSQDREEVVSYEFCNCIGYTDNKNWKDGKRIRHGNKEANIICISYSKQLLRQPSAPYRSAAGNHQATHA